MATSTILDFPQVTTLENTDLVWITRGTGTDRDKTIPGSVLKSFLGEGYLQVDSTGSIDLSNYTTNLIVVADGLSADITLTFTGVLPSGNKLLIINKDATWDANLAIESTTPTLDTNEFEEWFSDGTDMIKKFGMLDEDDFASDSDTAVPTQQSVKTYVDEINPIGTLKDIVSIPTGRWLLCNGETIGDVASGADNESADYEALFEIAKTKTEWGNAGTEVWANGDTVKLPDLRYEYGSFSMVGDQSTNLSVGNHIEFDTILSGNMSLSTGAGQSDGLVSVNPYKIYKINLSVRCTYSSTNGSSQFYMYDETGATAYTSVGRTRSLPITDSNNMDVVSSNCGYIDDLTAVSNISAYIDSSANIATIENDATILTIETPFLTKENTFIKY